MLCEVSVYVYIQISDLFPLVVTGSMLKYFMKQVSLMCWVRGSVASEAAGCGQFTQHHILNKRQRERRETKSSSSDYKARRTH